MLTILCERHVQEAIADLARRAVPRECCGVLLGTVEAIVEAVPISNIATDVGRFELDPAEHIHARRDARNRGLLVLGVFHSHVSTPALPSPRDLAEAAYPEYLCGIISLRNADAEFRLFELRPESYEEVRIVIDPDRLSRAEASR